MSSKKMLKMMWLKVRYGVKSYLLFLIGTILFIIIYFINLIMYHSEEVATHQSMFMVTFLYVPVLISQAIQTVEYSKCYYLVPRTSKERKRYMIFQNLFKMICSFVGTTILLGIGIAIQPSAAQYLLNWYLLSGISFAVVMGASGYSTYYLRKKQVSYKRYMVSYVITVIVMSGIVLSGMFFVNQKSIQLWMMISVGAFLAAVCYNLYYYVRFQKVEADYENINREEKRFFSRTSNSMM